MCPTRYRTRHFFNNSNTNEDTATKFEQEYVRCVRNEEECVCSVCLFRCNIFIGVRIIKEMPGSVVSGTPCRKYKTFIMGNRITCTLEPQNSCHIYRTAGPALGRVGRFDAIGRPTDGGAPRLCGIRVLFFKLNNNMFDYLLKNK